MTCSQEASVVWTPEMDVNLFYALMDHKPVGVNKHFHMIFIYEKFNQATDTIKLSVDQIWQRLSTLYDLKELVSICSLSRSGILTTKNKPFLI